jgi:hypothetical protein
MYPLYVAEVNGKMWKVLETKNPLTISGCGIYWTFTEVNGLVNGAEGRNRTGTGVAHCALNTACLPVPPLRQSWN